MEVNNRILELKKRVQKVIDYHTEQKNFAIDIHKGLYKKLEYLKELEYIENMPAYILDAYLIYKRAWYSNWQEKHLGVNNFDKEGYLDKLENEVKLLEEEEIKNLFRQVEVRVGKEGFYKWLFTQLSSEQKEQIIQQLKEISKLEREIKEI